MTEILLKLVAGLVLFLYGVSALSEALSQHLSQRTREIIVRFTKHILGAFLCGILITILLDSSSAVVIITLVLVQSGILPLRAALAIVLGANIGTTFSTQLIAMEVSEYSPILLAAGFLLSLFKARPALARRGTMLFYFGLLFLGILLMEEAVKPLKGNAAFLAWVEQVQHPVHGAAVGALVTLILQSSSATVAMALVLAKQGLLGLKPGIAIMLGAELGTCADTLVAARHSGPRGWQVGLFHLGFNVVTVAMALLVFSPFVALVTSMVPGGSINDQIARAHLLFNGLGALGALGFVPSLAKLLDRRTAYPAAPAQG